MLRKFKFYLIGVIPGLLIVFFILNKKGASCSGYLPNSRVIAETLSKKFIFSSAFTKEMQSNQIDETILRDSIIVNGHIDFERSQAQKQPCPTYTLIYPKENPRFEIQFEKCQENATFTSLKSLR